MDVKFLVYVWNVTHLSVMRIISYANVMYFTAYVYNNCAVCSYHCTVDFDGVTPKVAHHGTGNEEGNFSGFQGIHCGMFIKLLNRCV
jgi:hypothetical protein